VLFRSIAGYFGFADFDPGQPLIFSQRQYDILQQVSEKSSKQEIIACLSGLIEGDKNDTSGYHTYIGKRDII